MAKKPDRPCAGCGKLMWSSPRSLPAGRATCLDCRRTKSAARPAPTRPCRVCGTTVLSPAQVCLDHKGQRRRVCRWCGTEFVGPRGTNCCSDECRQIGYDQAPMLRRNILSQNVNQLARR